GVISTLSPVVISRGKFTRCVAARTLSSRLRSAATVLKRLVARKRRSSGSSSSAPGSLMETTILASGKAASMVSRTWAINGRPRSGTRHLCATPCVSARGSIRPRRWPARIKTVGTAELPISSFVLCLSYVAGEPGLGLRPFISFDDPADDRMSHHVRRREVADGDAVDSVQPRDRVDEPAVRVTARDIDLLRISADHHPAVLAEPGQEHLHLLACGVLRFVEDDESVAQGAAAHEGDGGDLDLAAGDAAIHLLGRHAVVERIVERPEIGIDLLLHVAGQEAEPFARFDCRAAEDQALHAAGDQLAHRLRDGEIGLARPGGS